MNANKSLRYCPDGGECPVIPLQEKVKALQKELAALASESVKRDIALAKLEAEVMAAIEAQNAQRWIPVAEGLPEHDGFVLILSKDKMDGTEQVNISAYTHVGFGGERLASKEWSAPYECFHKHDTVTHWMQLPKPPKGED